jgi:hypothetical protein
MLNIHENKINGLFIEGLQEIQVDNYQEAI